MPKLNHKESSAAFPATRWSVVVRAASAVEPAAHEALAGLYQMYWYPLYGFARGFGQQSADAEDMVQEFFVHLNGKNLWAEADPLRGKLRTFLLTCFRNFMLQHYRRRRTARRGGGAEHVAVDTAGAEDRYAKEFIDGRTPEVLYHYRWAMLLLNGAMQRLEQERTNAGREQEFRVLQQFLSIHLPTTDSYLDAARKLGASENKVTVAVFRLRRRYRELARKAVADTLPNPTEEEIEAEWQELLRIIGEPGLQQAIDTSPPTEHPA